MRYWWARAQAVHHTQTYFSENRAVANLGTVHNRTGRIIPKWNLLGSAYVVAMECPKNDDFLPRTKHTSAISRVVFDRVHHSQNGGHRNRTEVGSVARAMALVSQSPMSEPDSFIALPNHHFHACSAHQYRTSLYQFLFPGLPAHRKLCLVCGPLYSGPPGDLRQLLIRSVCWKSSSAATVTLNTWPW